MKGNVTYDDVYEIAAEVCEEMITKFLQNLVKLVPQAENVVDDIQEQQYRELQALREEKKRASTNKAFTGGQASKVNESEEDDFGLLGGEDFDAISHPDNQGGENSWAAKNDMDSALGDLGDLPPMGPID